MGKSGYLICGYGFAYRISTFTLRYVSLFLFSVCRISIAIALEREAAKLEAKQASLSPPDIHHFKLKFSIRGESNTESDTFDTFHMNVYLKVRVGVCE